MLNATFAGSIVLVIDALFGSWGAIDSAENAEAKQLAIDESYDLGLILLAAVPFVALVAFGTRYTSQLLANTCVRDLRQKFMVHLVRLDLGFHSGVGRGDMMTRVSADIDGIFDIQQKIYGKLLQRPLEIIGLLVMVYISNVYMGIAINIAMVPLTIVLILILGRMRRRARGAREAMAENYSSFEQITSGIRVIKSMGSSERENERFARTNNSLFRRNMRMFLARAQSDAFTEGGIFAAAAGVIFLGAWLFANNYAQPEEVIACLFGIGRITAAMRELQKVWGDMLYHIPAAERIHEIMDIQPNIVDKSDAIVCPIPSSSISIRDVRFAYEGDNDVLRGINLDIYIGETVALVGASGGGKSTLLDLIPRMHDVRSGAILWDGMDLKDLQQESVIQHCAIVQQDSFLFDDTVFENIRYGRPSATREEVEEAAKKAHVHDDILRLEGGKGYESPVGDRGSRLSGGQRQRVAIARAFLRDAPVLLMDEPTSALDAESENYVQAAIKELMARPHHDHGCPPSRHRQARRQNLCTRWQRR